jgi:predicted nucleic acid-binding protein
MMVHVDTSALVDALTGPRRSLGALTALVDEGHRLGMSAIVFFEWLRGPRTAVELAAQEALFPEEAIVPFGANEARLAAQVYKHLKRPRGRDIDIAIAASALAHGAAIWTLHRADFHDIPDLRVV